jgi:DNA-binding CsgD family transcriptional regulator
VSNRPLYTADDLRALVEAVSGDYAGSTLPEHVMQAMGALKPIVNHTAFVAYLVKKDGPTLPICSVGIDEQGIDDYPNHYIRSDPMRSTFGDPRARVTTLTECARQAAVDLKKNEFVNDFTLPRFGISHILGSNSLIDGETSFTFSLHRPRQLSDFTPKETEVLQIALPSLIRAFRVTHARDQALEALRKVSGDKARRERSGVAILSAELEIQEVCPVARSVLTELDESGGLAEVLGEAQRLVGQLKRDKMRTFADSSILRRIQSAFASIRVIAMRLSSGGRVSVQLMVDVVRSRAEPLVARLAEPYKLTPREIEVVSLLHEGLNQKAIGEKLGISTWSARNHLIAIREKLKVRTNEQILVRLLGVA